MGAGEHRKIWRRREECHHLRGIGGSHGREPAYGLSAGERAVPAGSSGEWKHFDWWRRDASFASGKGWREICGTRRYPWEELTHGATRSERGAVAGGVREICRAEWSSGEPDGRDRRDRTAGTSGGGVRFR